MSQNSPSKPVTNTETETPPPLSVDPASTSRGRSRKSPPWRLWGALGATAVAGLAGAMVVFSESDSTAAPPADVPRLDQGHIVFSQKFAERIQLESVEVRSAPLTPVVSAVGVATFDPKHVARVGTRLRGLVRSVNHYEGEQVTKGQALAEIDSPELGEAQANVTMLGAQVKTAERDANREKVLAERSLTTAREADEAATEHKSYESMLHAAQQKVSALAGGSNPRALGIHTLVAPLDGTIVERQVTKGELVEGDRVAFLIANLSHLWVELDVFERNLHAIRVGDEVLVHALSGSTQDIKGRVAQVGAIIDSATRSATVRIEIDNSAGLLRPGQAVDAKIHASNAAQATATLVPLSAVTFVDGEPTVFVLTDKLTVKPTIVVLGEGNGDERQVVKGLEPGQRVVKSGVFELKSELFR